MAGWDETGGLNTGRSTEGGFTREEGPFDTAQATLERALDSATEFIRERPVAALAGAVALGWFIGRMASSR
jgi:ElaB/YqjD/DUF883 family membrane-anchored ribosome-binding protein